MSGEAERKGISGVTCCFSKLALSTANSSSPPFPPSSAFYADGASQDVRGGRGRHSTETVVVAGEDGSNATGWCVRQDEWVIRPEQRLTFRVLLLQLLPLPCQRLSCLQHEAEGVMVMSALTFLQGCPVITSARLKFDNNNPTKIGVRLNIPTLAEQCGHALSCRVSHRAFEDEAGRGENGWGCRETSSPRHFIRPLSHCWTKLRHTFEIFSQLGLG